LYPQAYIDYLHYFHCDRDYFECHEVLEEHWKEKEANDRELHWVGLIQIAVGLYHHRRGNFNGAKRMLTNAVSIIRTHSSEIDSLALDSRILIKLLENQLARINRQDSYKSIDLPLTDETLLNSCMNRAVEENLVWGAPSDLQDQSLVHRHSTRNRDDVIQERLAQLMKRQQKKEG
jgi:predicted metal-dependent hydrolase